MPVEVDIYAKRNTARLNYTLGFVFDELFQIPWTFYSDRDTFEKAEAGIRINYSSEEIRAAYRIHPHELLFETEIFEQQITKSEWETLPVFFTVKARSELPFDPLAATFYCISRYEEYLPFVPDLHGRFPAEQSFAFKNDLLKRPLVNEWWKAISAKWEKAFSLPSIPTADFRFISTVDVDNSFAFKGKGPVRTLSATIRDIYRIDIDTLRRRWRTFTGHEPDPFDNYDSEMELAEERGFRLIYFVLYSELSPYDRNISRFSQTLRSSIRHIADFAELGIHPSYRSSLEPERMQEEHRGMEEIARRKINLSRQHYLRFRLPQTYRSLIELGITDEFSMGYARATGWRASTCTPFRFYDLEVEEARDLIVHPFPFMDSVYQDYLQLGPEEALREMMLFAKQCKELGGELVSVMHNRNFGDLLPEAKGWNECYHRLLDEVL